MENHIFFLTIKNKYVFRLNKNLLLPFWSSNLYSLHGYMTSISLTTIFIILRITKLVEFIVIIIIIVSLYQLISTLLCHYFFVNFFKYYTCRKQLQFLFTINLLEKKELKIMFSKFKTLWNLQGFILGGFYLVTIT